MELVPISLVTGEYRFYLPGYAVRNTATGFFLPTPEMTITIPSTARRVITVGAYDIARRSKYFRNIINGIPFFDYINLHSFLLPFLLLHVCQCVFYTYGAYDIARRSYADFSGRGYVYRYNDGRTDTAGGQQIIADVKPDSL